jgi:hypothetical protein
MPEVSTDLLRFRMVPLLRRVPSSTPPLWGKMTLQQMIEHFAEAVRIASGRTVFTEIHSAPEHLEKLRSFIATDKPFRENTHNPLLSEVPAPVLLPTVEEALAELQSELDYFFKTFEENKLMVTRNPIFGDLNYEQNLQLLNKHARHHLRQFGVTLEN